MTVSHRIDDARVRELTQQGLSNMAIARENDNFTGYMSDEE